MDRIKITDDRVLYEGAWTSLRSKQFIDRSGREKSWTYLERQGRREAVVIVPVTRESGALVLIRQFRLPFEAEVIEFPAGLVDPGESPEETAERELLEETGYRGELVDLGPPVASSAGLTTEVVYMAYMSVEEEPTDPTAHEDSELIEVIRVPPTKFTEALAEWRKEGVILDAKVYVHLTAVRS
jgi:8-oxo-dGTP pyrophosphatase MutT (NUDIX family)